MKKPDPSKSRIATRFENRFDQMVDLDELEQLKAQSPKLFTEEEMFASSWHLDLILRKICVENNISVAYFDEKYRLYATLVLGMDSVKTSNNRSNLYKALKAGNITYKRFIEVACGVLGFEIKDLDISLTTKTGKVQKFGLSKDKEKQK